MRGTPGRLLDANALNDLMGDAVAVNLDWAGAGNGRLNFALAALDPVPLRRMLPALQSMDLEVLEEQAGTWTRPDGRVCHIYHLLLQPGPDVIAALAQPQDEHRRPHPRDISGDMGGAGRLDGFNALILRASLNWRQVTVLRSCSRYLRQLPLPYGQTRIQRVLLDNPAAARALLDLFEARFDRTEQPADSPHRVARITRGRAASRRRDRSRAAHRRRPDPALVATYLDQCHPAQSTVHSSSMPSRSGRPIWFTSSTRNPSTSCRSPVRFPKSSCTHHNSKACISASGWWLAAGLRWSDRHDDYRTEVLGLVKAQAVKNAMIVPVGAKGVFVVKARPAAGESPRAVVCGATGSSSPRCSTSWTRPPLRVPRIGRGFGGVVCHDGPDPYLVVAADKGTATFSDSANAVALATGATGWVTRSLPERSAGYDHKAMGITARGAWVSGDTHLAELGIDSDSDEFSAVGIGDMSGDVSAMECCCVPASRLVAAFDHRHIFVDPQLSTPCRPAGTGNGCSSYRSRRGIDYDRLLDQPRAGACGSRTAKPLPSRRRCAPHSASTTTRPG